MYIYIYIYIIYIHICTYRICENNTITQKKENFNHEIMTATRLPFFCLCSGKNNKFLPAKLTARGQHVTLLYQAKGVYAQGATTRAINYPFVKRMEIAESSHRTSARDVFKRKNFIISRVRCSDKLSWHSWGMLKFFINISIYFSINIYVYYICIIFLNIYTYIYI